MDKKSQAVPPPIKAKPQDPAGAKPADAKSAPATSSATATGRIASIDALRGFDMFWIVGGDTVVKTVVGLFGALLPAAWINAAAPCFPSSDWFQAQIRHVSWEGFVAWDLIMPLFLFIVGASMPFSFSKRVQDGQGRKALYTKVLRRVAILWILGMIVQGNLLDFDLSKLHLFSNTLQAIAVGYLVAAVALIHLSIGLQVSLCVVLLVGYWLLLLLVPFGGHAAGTLEEHANLALYLDQLILGRFQDQTTYAWLLGSMGFAGTVLFGVFSGHLLRTGWSPWVKFATLLVIGGALLGLGWLWAGGLDGLSGFTLLRDWRCPIIKHLFTSSMVLWACGWSYLLLALFYVVIDVLGFRRWSFFFIVIGANAIFAYMVAHVISSGILAIAKDLVGGLADYLGSLPDPGPAFAGALVPLVAFTLFWLVLLYMYRKGTLIRV
jgi:predicted acyltransferase